MLIAHVSEYFTVSVTTSDQGLVIAKFPAIRRAGNFRMKPISKSNDMYKVPEDHASFWEQNRFDQHQRAQFTWLSQRGAQCNCRSNRVYLVENGRRVPVWKEAH